MKRNLFLLAISVCISSVAFTQTADDALRFSELRFGGSARGMAVAGAFGAIGADYSSVITNPAGLGLFQKHELMFTVRLEHIKTEALYDGTIGSDRRANFNVGNLGVVFTGRKRKDGDWKNINFGIGYNRLANFHAERFYRSTATGNSILNGFVNEMNGIHADDIAGNTNISFASELAYNAFLIDPLITDSTQYRAVTDGIDVDQRLDVVTRGALDELSFSVAGNYKHKLYVGAYLGIPFIFYKERSYHKETSTVADDDFNYLEVNRSLNTRGVGVNFKMGVIYRPSDWIRFGASFHTPSYFGMREDFSTSVYSDFDTIAYFAELPDISEFSYNLSTPMRAVGSVGVILKKYAFLSFDYEWVDYSRAQFRMDPEYSDFESGLNTDISGSYGTAHIFRAGAEVALNKIRLRAGYAHYGSPYDNAVALGDFDGSANYYTGGIGVRLKKVYFDFAYVRGKTKAVGVAIGEQLSRDETTRNSFMFTTGFRF